MMVLAGSQVVGSWTSLAASPMSSDGGSSVGALIAGIGVVGLVIGFLLIRRIGRSIDDAEGHPSPWRFRGSPKPGPSVPDPRDAGGAAREVTGRGLRGRRMAWLILAAALVLDALVVLLFASAPSTMGGGGWFREPPRFVWLIPAFGIALNLAGLAWMIRIVRADPERHASFWRSKRS